MVSRRQIVSPKKKEEEVKEEKEGRREKARGKKGALAF